MSAQLQYQTVDMAAANVDDLVEYLFTCEGDSQEFVYRGQVKEWHGPLLPSHYRRSIRRARTLTSKDGEYRHRLRGQGTRFAEMKPDSSMESIGREHPISAGEYRRILELAFNPDFAKALATSGMGAALTKYLTADALADAQRRATVWQTYLDNIHRGMIRHMGFVQPFGYPLGMTLAQQYGFTSELLDFTSDVRVAAFFATHDAPHYSFDVSSLAGNHGSDIGVIYRLPSTRSVFPRMRVDSHNYYTCPTQIHMSELCAQFEAAPAETKWEHLPQLSHSEMSAVANFSVVPRLLEPLKVAEELALGYPRFEDAADRYLRLYYEGQGRWHRLLDMETGSFARSRLGRQRAVVLVPDELRVTEHPEEGFDYATFQAVEDVSGRDGFERFYFRHSAQRPASIDGMIREFLWPSTGDTFETLISRVLDPSLYQYWFDGKVIPKRLDLVSRGYSDVT